MNPYEANLRNVSARMGAWARGMLRLYRKPLIVLLLASVTTAVGVSAASRGEASGSAAGAVVMIAGALPY